MNILVLVYRPGISSLSCDLIKAPKAPLYNFKTSHAMATKITQNKVLMISNLRVYFEWHNNVI